MTQAKLDALVLTPGTSLRYFTGIRWYGGERLFACVVPRRGEPFFVCPAFEEDRAHEQIALGPFAGAGADVRTWQEDESPYALVAGGLQDRGAATGAIGIDETAKFVLSDGIAAARPGAPLESVDAAARKVIVDAGFGPGFKYFSHRLGHGIGMDGHEWPYLVENDMFGWKTSLAAQPGMTFSDEPGIYIRGEFGVRLEDDMVITAEGARLFTPQSESLEKPF